jgi:pyruvate formate lyase activating enzyme
MSRIESPDFGVKGFIPTSMVDWPGILSSVIFIGGCGFRCLACHNHDLVLNPDSLPNLNLKDIIDYLSNRKNWIDGVTVTGGEPTMRRDLPGLLKILRSLGMMIKLDTNGANPMMLDELIHGGLVDSVSMDVKAPLTQEAYSAICGVKAPLRSIIGSIGILKRSSIDVTFRTTLIPGMVEEPELAKIRDYLGDDRRYIIQPFRNLTVLDRSLGAAAEFEPDRMEKMKNLFENDPPRLMAS